MVMKKRLRWSWATSPAGAKTFWGLLKSVQPDMRSEVAPRSSVRAAARASERCGRRESGTERVGVAVRPARGALRCIRFASDGTARIQPGAGTRGIISPP